MQACQGRGPSKPCRCPAVKRRAAVAPGEACPEDTVSQGWASGPDMPAGAYYLDVPRATIARECPAEFAPPPESATKKEKAAWAAGPAAHWSAWVRRLTPCPVSGATCPTIGECPVGYRFSGEAPCATGKAPGPVAGFVPPTMVAASNWSRVKGDGAARGFDRGGVTGVHPGEDRIKTAVNAVDAARFKARYPGGAPWAKSELVGLRDEGRRPGRVALPRRASDWTLPAKSARLPCV